MNELDRISETIETYLKAIKTGDSKYFKRAFYPDAVVINAGEADAEKSVTPIADFASSVKKRHEDGVYLEEIPLGVTISQGCQRRERAIRLSIKYRGD